MEENEGLDGMGEKEDGPVYKFFFDRDQTGDANPHCFFEKNEGPIVVYGRVPGAHSYDVTSFVLHKGSPCPLRRAGLLDQSLDFCVCRP